MIASSNNGKIQEVQKILNNYEIEPIDRKIEVEEDQETFEKNAIKKA